MHSYQSQFQKTREQELFFSKTDYNWMSETIKIKKYLYFLQENYNLPLVVAWRVAVAELTIRRERRNGLEIESGSVSALS